MSARDPQCFNKTGKAKERWPTREAARKALLHKGRFRKGRWPNVYQCDVCAGWHMGHFNELQ